MAPPLIRLVRSAPDPLGLFLRVAQAGQKDLQTFITAGDAAFSGVVFEAKRVEKQKELLALVLEHRIDAVLDPQTQAMATLGGYARPSMDNLPWSLKRPHTVNDFSAELARRKFADEIAQFAIKYGFTQILAPTHLIAGPNDPWLDIDIATTTALRSALQRRNASSIQINYSLAISYEAFRNAAKRSVVLDRLKSLDIDSLWLHVDGCGSDSSPTAVTKYGDAATDFHCLGVPIVADHMGGLVGLALLAFGAVGGVSHGITVGERFSCGHWKKAPTGKGFAQGLRVYFPDLDLMLPRIDAEKVFETGGKARSAFGCRNTSCCSRGIPDMLQAPVRHFLFKRTREVAGLSQIPESLRPTQFLEEHLRPASDRALVAMSLALPEPLQKKMASQSKRLNELRIALGTYAQKRREHATFAQHPKTRAAREIRRS